MPLTQQTIDLILALVAIELVLLLAVLARVRRLDLAPALTCFLLSGAAILVALRFAMAQEVNETALLGLLGLSFPLHIATLFLAWRAARK